MKSLPNIGDRVKVKRGFYAGQKGAVRYIYGQDGCDVAVEIDRAVISFPHEMLIRMIPVKKPREIWVNYYNKGFTSFHFNLDNAFSVREHDKDFIRTVRFIEAKEKK